MSGTSALALLAAAAATDDELARLLLLLARAVTERRHAPGRARVAARCVVRLAAAVRVVDGVHGHTAGLRALAAMARAPSLAQLHKLVLGVADSADRGARLH